jgi:hypothetical protein
MILKIAHSTPLGLPRSERPRLPISSSLRPLLISDSPRSRLFLPLHPSHLSNPQELPSGLTRSKLLLRSPMYLLRMGRKSVEQLILRVHHILLLGRHLCRLRVTSLQGLVFLGRQTNIRMREVPRMPF